jgi:hypothetical protein
MVSERTVFRTLLKLQAYAYMTVTPEILKKHNAVVYKCPKTSTANSRNVVFFIYLKQRIKSSIIPVLWYITLVFEFRAKKFIHMHEERNSLFSRPYFLSSLSVHQQHFTCFSEFGSNVNENRDRWWRERRKVAFVWTPVLWACPHRTALQLRYFTSKMLVLFHCQASIGLRCPSVTRTNVRM